MINYDKITNVLIALLVFHLFQSLLRALSNTGTETFFGKMVHFSTLADTAPVNAAVVADNPA